MQFNELLSQNHVHGSDIGRVAPERVVDCSKCYISIRKPYLMVKNKLTVYDTRGRCTSYAWNPVSAHNLEGRLYFTSIY